MERGCQPRASGRERSVPVAADIFYASLFLFGLGVGLLMVFRCVCGLILGAEL